VVLSGLFLAGVETGSMLKDPSLFHVCSHVFFLWGLRGHQRGSTG